MARVSQPTNLRYAALWWWFVVLVTVGVPLVIRFRIGPIPENDDWSYIKSALAMHHGDGVQLQGFGQMFLIGQLVAVQPFLWVFGDHAGAFDAFGAVAALAWLWLVFVTLRRAAGRTRALLIVCVVAAWPGLGLLATSFMTDAPFAALCWAQIYVAIRAFESGRRSVLVAAFPLAVVAFTFREQSIAVTVAIAVYAIFRRANSTAFRRYAVVGSLLTVIVCAVLEHARRAVPNADVAPYGLSSFDVVGGLSNIVRAVFTLGLALSPLAFRFAVVTAAHRNRPVRTVLAWAATLTVGAYLLAGHSHNVLVGNYVSRTGGYANAVAGVAPAPVNAVVWAVVQTIALVSTAVLVGASVQHAGGLRRLRPTVAQTPPERALPFLFAATLGVLYVALSFVGEDQYDRYLLPVLPVAALAVLRISRPPTRDQNGARDQATGVGVAVLIAMLYLVGSLITYSTLVRDRTVWDAASRLTADGIPATMINAGSDWDGFHATTPVHRDLVRDENAAYFGDFWIQRFPQSSDCYVVSASPLSSPGWQLVSTRTGSPFGFGSFTAYTYKRTDHRPFGAARC
jgi:Dolichyl-phosphate-mannose-protein mannosyltransferase